MNRSVLSRIAFCTALLLPRAAFSQPALAPNFQATPIRLEVHGLVMTWNGVSLAGIPSLEQHCRSIPTDERRRGITVASGIDTAQSRMHRIVSIVKSYGFKPVIFDILIYLDRKQFH